MRRPGSKSWSQLKVGLVILLALAGVLVAILNLNEGLGVLTHRVLLRAELDDSQGLKVGAPVRMSGVSVGNVKRIAINGHQGKVDVEFTVINEVRALLHQDAVVVVRAMGSILWRAGRWRRGQSSLAEVANRLDVLAETLRWRTAEGGALGHIVAATGR